MKIVNEIFQRFMGSPGYLKVRDFYFTILFRVLENSQEKDLVLTPIFNFLFSSLLVSTDLIGNEYRFYRLIDITNYSTELTRAAFGSVEKILIKMTRDNLNLFLNISDLTEILQTNNLVLLKQQNMKKRQKIINRALSVADGELDPNLLPNMIDDVEQEPLIPLSRIKSGDKQQLFERKVSSVHSEQFITNQFGERSSGGEQFGRNRARPLSLKVLSSKIRLTHKPMKCLMGYNADLLVLSKIPFEVLLEHEKTEDDSPKGKNSLILAAENTDQEQRLKILTLWRYLYSIVDFDKFTTATLKDARVYEIFNRWIMLTSQILAIATSFGSNYQDVTSSKYTRVGFHMIQDMFMDKLNQVFGCLFAGDGLQKTSDKETTQRLLTVRARLIEVFILMILRVECVPHEVLEMVIRELNRDPGIIHGIVEENSSFETSLFIMEYRNQLKATALLVPNIYTSRQKFIHQYFPPLMYSLMGERHLCKTGLYCTVFHQTLTCVAERPTLSRSKLGPICSTMMNIYLEYKTLCEQFRGLSLTEKTDLLKQHMGGSTFNLREIRRHMLLGTPSQDKKHLLDIASPLRAELDMNDQKSANADQIDNISQKVTKTDPQISEDGDDEFAQFGAHLNLPGFEQQGPNRRSTTPVTASMIPDWQTPLPTSKKVEPNPHSSLSDKKNSSNEEILSAGSFFNCLNDEYVTESELEEIIKSMEDIVNFGNDVLLFTGSEIKKTAGLQMTPFYIVMKFYYMLDRNRQPDTNGYLGDQHQQLFEGFLRSIKDNSDQLRLSFKTGEILVYLFFMMQGCRLVNHTAQLFMEVITQIRNGYIISEQGKRPSKIIDNLICELWLSHNLRDFSWDRSRLEKQINVVTTNTGEQQLELTYAGFLESCVKLVKQPSFQVSDEMTQASNPSNNPPGSSQSSGVDNIPKPTSVMDTDFDCLFEEQNSLEAGFLATQRPRSTPEEQNRELLKMDSWVFKQRAEAKMFESACRPKLAKLNFLQNRAVSTIQESSLMDHATSIKTVMVPSLLMDQLNCVLDPSNMPDEFKVGKSD